MGLSKSNTGRREISRDSVQSPLGVYRLPEGYKCIEGLSTFTVCQMNLTISNSIPEFLGVCVTCFL
ncbi:hypothetical protein LA52FAK_06830 [Desulforhopalus sp. 52FAK]